MSISNKAVGVCGFLAALLVFTAVSACARRVPPSKSASSLYRDLERVVTLAEATGWHIDRVEVEKLLPDALESSCRVRPEIRADVLRWLDMEILAEGGPVESAYKARGRKLKRVERLLTLTRIRAVLASAVENAEDCPFWIEPQERFAGRQISDDRWQISGGGGGKLIVARRGGDSDLRFGGAGRFLLGRSFGSRSGLYTGLELGGNGSFPRSEDGERGALVLGLDLVVPLVYRHTMVNSYLEMEGGWLGSITETEDDEIDHGVHVGAAFGARAGRARWLFPGGAIGVSWERTFPKVGPALYTFKVGFRAAFDIDL